jgi:DNA-binding transcriptional LysR family regulator
MDISRLKVFLTVVDQGSISKAADSLNYAQSNITARIKQLERDLGKPLLFRNSKGVKPTPAGLILYDYGKKILSICDEAEIAVKNVNNENKMLKIGAIEEVATVKLPKLLANSKNEISDFDIDMIIGNTAGLINLVIENNIDGAYIVGPIKNNSLKQQYIMEDSLVLISNKSDSKTIDLKSIENKKILLTNPNCLYKDRLTSWFEEKSISLGRVMEFGSLEGLLNCVKNGVGITVMANSLFEDLGIKDEVSWKLLPKKFGKVEIYFIMRQDSPITETLQRFIESHHFK